MIRTYIIIFFALSVAIVTGCQEQFELDADPPAVEEGNFQFAVGEEGENYLVFTNTSTGFIKKWDFGNGTTAEGNEVKAYYPFSGKYEVKLTVYTKGGSVTTSDTVVIEHTDPEICNVELLKLLTGGCGETNGKTWVIDSTGSGHMGVGPSASVSPEWWQASPNDKAGTGLYNDEFTFYLNQSVFKVDTKGDVYLNTAQSGDFPGAVESPKGDFTAPFVAAENMNYAISEDGDGNQFINLTNGGFIGYATGVHTYQILSLSENELFLRFLDAASGDLAWYHRLVPKGFVPEQPEQPEGYSLPIDLESGNAVFGDFEGASTTLVDNPSSSGINTSSKVAAFEKTTGSPFYAGTILALTGPLDFGSNNAFRLKVNMPKTGVVKLKLENESNPDINVEVDATNSLTNEWEELTFHLSPSALTQSYSKVILFFDFENAGDGSVYYFDDISLAEVVPPLLIDFELDTYVFTDFEGASTSLIDNPASGGINTSAKVAAFEKTVGAQFYAGTIMELPSPIDFGTNTTFRVKVNMPKTGVVKLKLENGTDSGINVEVDATNTMTNEWEELEFVINEPARAQSYTKIILFFDFENGGDGTVYYFDDISLGN